MHVMVQLSLDVAQQGARPDAKQVRLCPLVSQLLLHERHPRQGVLGRPYPSSGLEPDLVPRHPQVVSDRPHHHQGDRKSRVHSLLPGGRLDEVGAGHHADETRLVHVGKSAQLTRGEDRLEVGVPARLPARLDFVVKGLPVAREHVGARDDDVDLRGPERDGLGDLLEPLFHRGLPRRKSRGYGGDRDTLSVYLSEGVDGVLDARGVHADCAHCDSFVLHAECLDEVLADGCVGLVAEPAHVARGVVTVQRGEVDAGHDPQQPRGLPLLLYRTPRLERGSSGLRSWEVNPHSLYPGDVKGNSRVPFNFRHECLVNIYISELANN